MNKMPKGFSLVSDVIEDCLLDIRYYSTFNFVGARVDGYLDPVAIMTNESLALLKKASDEFRKMGYLIKVFDAYRPQKAVDHFVRWSMDLNDERTKEYFYPMYEKATLFELDFISKNSNHSRGSTIDLTLFDPKTGMDLDMGGGFDYFGDLSHADYEDITEEQKKNRMILRTVMIQNGFRPFNGEWWHFTMVNEPYPNQYFDFDVMNYHK